VKGYVKKVKPKVSMEEGYIYDKTIGFVIEYMHEFKHVGGKIWDVEEEKGVCGEVLEGVATKFILDPNAHDLAHQYVVTNVAF
jgi:hypothetical protein